VTDPDDRPADGLAGVLAGVVAAEITAALEETARALLPVAAAERVGDEHVWSREGRRFAVQGGSTASFRIGAEIGAAALRTPDVGGSQFGPDWVAFSPRTLDGHARDRLVAWFLAAHRRAAP
jgi:hypothetical protein